MAETPAESQPTSPETTGDDTPIRYPTNTVVGVIDSQEQLEAAIAALTGGGFLADEIRAGTGAATADAVNASTGRTGLGHIALRIAERLGIEDSEMEFKSQYVQAMRDGRFVILVSAPTEPRKERATEILREHDAHALRFFGRYSIEGIVPPRDA
jgi:hypothetical protein